MAKNDESPTTDFAPAPTGFLETLILALAPSVLALFVVPAILGGKNLPAQTLDTQATKLPHQQKAAQPRLPVLEAIAAGPPAAPAPISPANQPPSPARVTWDSCGLEIEASNSSLNQILHQVAADMGFKLEGLTQDQRVFGSYGPGPGSDVLWKLLEGSGYNVLMIGGRDADTPPKIILSARLSPSRQTGANNQSRSDSNVDEVRDKLKHETRPDNTSEPSHSQPNQNPFANGEPAGDPLQLMQEILQRQQRIDQHQQKQDEQNNPHQ